MIYQKVKGMLDYIENEADKFRYIEKCVTDEIKKHGFREIITPILENTEVFVHSVGDESDIVTKEMYTFFDKGNRSLTLRPEGTAPVARSYIENKLYSRPALTKLYYFGPMFRYERPQAGRYRQFYQFGVEAFGDSSPLLDGDLIYSGYKIFERLGIKDIVLKINSIGDFLSREAYAIKLRQYFFSYRDRLCEDCQRRLEKNPLRILDCKVDRNQPYFRTAPKISDSLTPASRAYFQKALDYLTLLGVSYEIDYNLVRGLDYYTEIVFEYIYQGDDDFKGLAICAGGKYSNLISDFGGPDIPGIGYAFGLERIMALMDRQNLFPALDSGADIVIIALDELSKEHSLYLANILRNRGYRTEIDYYHTTLKPQFRFAERLNALFIIIIGEEERINKSITIKNTKRKTQETIKEEKLLDYLKEH